MNKLLFVAILVGVLSVGLYSSPVGAIPQLNMSIGARAAGMGGAVVAKSSDQLSVLWNPAGLGRLENKEFVADVSASMQYDRSLHYLGYAQRLESGIGFGVGLILSGVDDIDRVDVDGNIIGSGKYTNSNVYLSGGKEFDNFSFGASLKILQQEIMNESEVGFGFDAGILYDFEENLTLGAAFKNVGSKIGDAKVDMVLQTGIYYKVSKIFGVEFDFVRNFEREESYIRVGGELDVVENMFTIRAGADDGNLMFGVSFITETEQGLGIGLDYAYISENSDIFDDSHRVSLNFKF